MSLTRISLGLVSMILASSSFASEAIRYSGTGSAEDVNGWNSPCSSISLSVLSTDDQIELSNLRFVCGAISKNHDPIKLAKRAGNLFRNSEKVGTYTANEIDIVLPEEHVNDLLFVVRILKKGDELIYKEDWLSQQDGGLDQTFDMTGTLKPFSN
jgi:hypothetical protein